MSTEERFKAAVNVIRNLPKNGKEIDLKRFFVCVYVTHTSNIVHVPNNAKKGRVLYVNVVV